MFDLENQTSGFDIAEFKDLRFEILTSLEDIDAVATAWQQLEQRARDPMTYFQSYDWCRSWCRYYAVDASLAGMPEGDSGLASPRICTVWEGERLILVWPLMSKGSWRSVRKITTLTEPHSQYSNVIVDPDLRQRGVLTDVIEHCLDHLDAMDAPDVIVFDSTPEKADRSDFAELDATVETSGASAWMDLSGFTDWQDYRAALSASTRRGRNKRRNALARLGDLNYEVKFGGEDGFSDLIRTGIEFKRQWLVETGRPTRALNLPNVVEFLSDLSGDGGAVAAALALNGRPIAIEIGFLWHGRFYSYLGAFDWSLRKYSPGKVQLEEALRWCIERGVTAYDLLGDPSTYKSDWSNRSTPLSICRMTPTIRGKAFVSMWSKSALPAAKYLLKVAPHGIRTRLIPFAEDKVATATMVRK